MCVAKKDVFWFRVNAFFIEKKKASCDWYSKQSNFNVYFQLFTEKRQNIMRSVEIVKTSKTNTLVKKQTLDYRVDWTQ